MEKDDKSNIALDHYEFMQEIDNEDSDKFLQYFV